MTTTLTHDDYKDEQCEQIVAATTTLPYAMYCRCAERALAQAQETIRQWRKSPLAGPEYTQQLAQAQEEIARLKGWIDDLQSGMYVNCVYCGHRYGPGETTPVTMADTLKTHVEQCPKHPMSALRAQVARLVVALRNNITVSWVVGSLTISRNLGRSDIETAQKIKDEFDLVLADITKEQKAR